MSEDYKLPPEVHDAICEEIKKDLFDGKEPVSNPQIFILGGQPGAGKVVFKTGDKGVVKAIADEREKPMSHEDVRCYDELAMFCLIKCVGMVKKKIC